ncbi:hypothetical protein EWM64_g3300 [Hericium alpestre]|uniref:FAD-binding domain-containing protein n=1 Tax=Hericium alpestre TaxID=135208 RepID=A0A4Z0A496_9AGAM|nr:hypothetical protein EWM64_g3300 [Hericium alpestre]
MRAMVYGGRTKHIIAYPIAGGTIINFVGFYTVSGAYESLTPYPGKWMRDVSVERIKKCYEGFEEEVQGLVQCIRTATARRIHILGDVPNYAVDRAAILGDAAHAMETNFGASAGQAMEARLERNGTRVTLNPFLLQDAYYLGRLLAHPLTTLDGADGTTDVATALKIYEHTRLDFSNTIVHNARAVGQTYDFDNAMGPPPDFLARLRKGEDREAKEWLEKWRGNLNKLWAFQWDTEAIDRDWATTEELLKKAAGGQ